MPRKSSKEKRECFVCEGTYDFEKEVARLKVCKDLPIKHQHNGNFFCVLHFPNDEKHLTTNFEQVFDLRLENQENDFSYVYFSNNVVVAHHQFYKETRFYCATFVRLAIFVGTIFNEEAFFNKINFIDDVDFGGAKFLKKADFWSTKFSQNNNFTGTVFATYTDFSSATFDLESNTSFKYTVFSDLVSFSFAILNGYIIFEGSHQKTVFVNERTCLNLQDVRMEKSERLTFKNVRLRPNWFVNVNSRNLIFHDVDWEYADGTQRDIKFELKAVQERKITGRPYRLLAITCRQLAINFEENNYYEQSSKFRRMALESVFLEKRLSLLIWFLIPLMKLNIYIVTKIRYKEHWRKIYNRWFSKHKNPLTFWQSIDPTYFLYRLLSFYGESWGRAFSVLMLILVGFAFIYTKSDFQTCPKDEPVSISISACKIETEKCKCVNGGLDIWEGVRHSLATASFQTIEYRKPITGWGETLVILEKILAPLQTALLALAIRRKFMR